MKRTVSLILVLVFVLALSVTAFAASAPGDTIVYRLGSGKKYHTATCSTLSGKEPTELTLAEAVSSGLEPCSKCNPPTLAEESSTSASSAASSAAGSAAAAASTAKRGFLSGVSPVLTFFIGVLVGAVAITYVRGRILMKQDAEAEAAEAEAEEAEEETKE